MDRLLTVRDVMERYQCSRQTASKIIHQLPHMEQPRLLVREKTLARWESWQEEKRA